MNSETLGLIFAGVSAICAVFSLIQAHKSKKKKSEAEEIVNNLKRNIRNINNLDKLEPQIKQLMKLSKDFRTISSGKFKQRGCEEKNKTKTEMDFYIELKEGTAKILEVIPCEYKSVRDNLNDINGAYSFCINNVKTFPELDRNNTYSYDFVEKKYQDALSQLNDAISNIKFLNGV